jgi:hypothetical protein
MSAMAPLSSRRGTWFPALAVRTQGTELGLACFRRGDRARRP